MGREEELDAMSEADKETDILARVKEHEAIRITSRPAMAFWGAAIDHLKAEGKVKTDFIENYEGQYSYLLVTFP